MTLEKIFLGLNTVQSQAVRAVDGPVLILAGAGSGKTKCLTHRLAYLVATQKASLDEIVTVTFTNKASQEIGNRILEILDHSFSTQKRDNRFVVRQRLPWVGTFHSICVRLLRAESANIGLAPNFTIFDSEDSLSLIRSVIRELNLDPKQYSPAVIRSMISGAKNELLSPEEYARDVQGHFQSVVLDVYHRYQRQLNQLSALDFDDLILATVRMLEQFVEIRYRYHQQFRYLMVDEYQDTNHAQYRLTALLTNPQSQNICVVGDDHQAIYGWRGANFQNILNFNRDFPQAKVFKLEQNYRSTKTILAGARQVIQPIRRRSDKNLWTTNEEGAPITVYEGTSGRDEAEFIATEIKSLRVIGFDWHDFAVLYRTNAQSRLLEEVFLSSGIPYRLVGAVRFYERKEIKDLLAYLRLLLNPADHHALSRIINVPPRGIGPKTLARGGNKVERFLQQMATIRLSLATSRPRGLIEEIVGLTGYRDYLDDGTPEGEGRWENVEELLNLAAEFEQLSEFLEHVALVSDVDNYDPQAAATTLMTLHSSKGLEFTVVFLIGMEEGLFPHRRALEEESEMDEERRLCYVGMTRAKKRLYLTLARQRIIHGSLIATVPSRFISEIDKRILDHL